MLTFGQADIARTIGPTMLARGRIVHAQGQVNRCRRQRGPHRHRRARPRLRTQALPADDHTAAGSQRRHHRWHLQLPRAVQLQARCRRAD